MEHANRWSQCEVAVNNPTEWLEFSERFAVGNEIVGTPARMSDSCAIKFKGKGNRLVIEDGVEFARVTLKFIGDGNTILFRRGSRPSGVFTVGGKGTIEVGERTRMNKPCWFQAIEGKTITIGAECLLADIRVRTSDVHSILSTITGRRLNLARDVTIGERVWIAEKAHVYKGATIGEGSIIGAHAIVVKAIPPDCLAVGNPARVVKENVTWVRKLLGPEGDPCKIKSAVIHGVTLGAQLLDKARRGRSS